jgi:light-regulated signal transduction histidine kinase (bacteriophytochrome)
MQSDAVELLNFTVDGAKRMGKLLEDLRRYARATGQLMMEEPVDCEAVMDQVLVNLKPAIVEADATITRGPLPKVMGSNTHLLQLFQNLVDNAVKYRAERPLKIHVSAEVHDTEWVFRVADNGIGIEPQYSDRIFEPFHRLCSEERQCPGTGTGMGLAICRRIIQRYGGRIWVESEPGSGSVVSFTIPASRVVDGSSGLRS